MEPRVIDPLPQSPFPPRSVEGTKTDQAPGSDVFAQALAAGGVPVRPLPGQPPMPDHGPAIVHAPIDEEASALDPTSQSAAGGREGVAPVVAEVFNQDGFFGTFVGGRSSQLTGDRGSEVPLSHQTSETALASVAVTRRDAYSAPEPCPQTVVSASSPGDIPTSASGFAALPEGPLTAPTRGREVVSAPTEAEPSALDPVSPLATRPRSAMRSAQPHIATPEPTALEPPEVPERALPVARRFALREPAARSVVRVVLSELEQGLSISARTEALDASERVRLHDEIAALLARHGLSARAIRINAPDRSALLQEKFK